MGVKFAHALEAHVVRVYDFAEQKETHSASEQMRLSSRRMRTRWKSTRVSFDFILDAVSADHDIIAYLNLLRRDGNLTLVGAPEKLSVAPFALIMGRRSLSGSPIRRY